MNVSLAQCYVNNFIILIMSSTQSPRREFFGGVRAEAPILLGVVPFGLIYGALAIQLGVSAVIAQGMSSVLFGGSSQVIALPLIATAAPGIVLVLTVVVVNLRHALYSASLAPYLQRLSPLWKVVLAYLLTDEAYAVAIVHFQAPHEEGESNANSQRHWYMLGAGLTLWTTWQISTAIGLFVGGKIPPEWSLDFALPLTFIALVVPMLKTRALVVAAVVAGIAGVATFGLPYKLGYIVAAVVAIAVGLVVEARWKQT